MNIWLEYILLSQIPLENINKFIESILIDLRICQSEYSNMLH